MPISPIPIQDLKDGQKDRLQAEKLPPPKPAQQPNLPAVRNPVQQLEMLLIDTDVMGNYYSIQLHPQ